MATSTLSELHIQVINIMYSYLNTIDNTSWNNPSQVFYNTVSEWDSSIIHYFKKNKTNLIRFPFCTITRDNELDNTLDFSKRNWYSDYFSARSSSQVNTYECLPVRVPYELKIYTDKFDTLESFCESLIFMRGRNISHTYISSIIDQEIEINIMYDSLPKHYQIPDAKMKYTEKGSIYALSFPFTARGVIAINTGISSKIQDIVFTTDIDGNINTEEIPK